MDIPRHNAQLLVIIAEASIETSIVHSIKQHGAHGYTVTEVRGGGASGEREGSWDADRTIRIEVVCQPDVASAIAADVMARYAPHFGITLFFVAVQVLRPDKY